MVGLLLLCLNYSTLRTSFSWTQQCPDRSGIRPARRAKRPFANFSAKLLGHTCGALWHGDGSERIHYHTLSVGESEALTIIGNSIYYFQFGNPCGDFSSEDLFVVRVFQNYTAKSFGKLNDYWEQSVFSLIFILPRKLYWLLFMSKMKVTHIFPMKASLSITWFIIASCRRCKIIIKTIL